MGKKQTDKFFGRNKKILVAMGGPSEEKDVSLESGRAVLKALKTMGLDAAGLVIGNNDASKFFMKSLKELRPDVCFLAIHGNFGEDGDAQKILASLGIPYTGSGPEGSMRAFNKITAKKIMTDNNIPTPGYMSLKKEDEFSDGGLSYPLVIKPACQGSTIGIGIAEEVDQIQDALKSAFKYGNEVLVEEFVAGKELTVAILGDMALPVVEIRSKRPIFDYHAKYSDAETEYIVPAEIAVRIESEIKRIGLLVHNSLGLRDFSRIDLILSEKEIPAVLEANTIPGLTERSLFPKACRAANITYEAMCCKLLEMALCRN